MCACPNLYKCSLKFKKSKRFVGCFGAVVQYVPNMVTVGGGGEVSVCLILS